MTSGVCQFVRHAASFAKIRLNDVPHRFSAAFGKNGDFFELEYAVIRSRLQVVKVKLIILPPSDVSGKREVDVKQLL